MNPDSQNNEYKEKRNYPRKIQVAKVSYKVMMGKKLEVGSRAEALTQNISEEGVCLMLNRKLLPGAILELKFDLPGKNSKPIETLVKVVWQKKTEKGFLTGLKFGV
jgi:hypothetical protein